MDLARLLLRMSLWLRRPPPRRAVLVAAAVLAVSLLLYGLERAVGWPDWLTVNKPVGRPGSI